MGFHHCPPSNALCPPPTLVDAKRLPAPLAAVKRPHSCSLGFCAVFFTRRTALCPCAPLPAPFLSISYPSDSQFRNSFLQHISTPLVLCPGLLLLCGSQSPEPPFNSTKYMGSVCLFSSPLDCKLHEGWACLARNVHNWLCRKSNWNTLYMKSPSHVLVFLTQLCSARAPSSWLPSSALC